ncbi:MAG: nucleotidyl transferase AbiEii/AbiGii toxin family protein [Rhodanobacter sp.]
MFERPHHQRIASLLGCLDAMLLRDCGCLFGGGTAVALRFGEYRESLDVDFLVSDPEGYRRLRQLLAHGRSLAPIVRAGTPVPILDRDVRADQYGIRTAVKVDGIAIKLEIVREARIELDSPSRTDEVCGVATLTVLDLAASKLLANSDRGLDDSTFARDVIDLAMIAPRLPLLRQAIGKAEQPYGDTIRRDLARSLDLLRDRQGWLDRCMLAMQMRTPRALLWQRLRSLRRVLV